MAKCKNVLKVALVAMLVVAVVESGPTGEKLATCCTSVNKRVITDLITGYMIQKPSGSCVPAVIFQTEKGLFCSLVSAPWVRRKIRAFEEAKAKARLSSATSTASSSTVSLLSIITSTASPDSASTPLFSSSSTSSSSFSSSSSIPSSSSSSFSTSFTPITSSYSSSPPSSHLPSERKEE